MFWDRLRTCWRAAPHESDRRITAFTVDRRTRVQLDCPMLRYAELAAKIERLRLAGMVDRCPAFVFDFSRVEEIEAPWTPVFAALVDLCRRSGARCVITGLHGQPSAMADLVFGRRGVTRVALSSRMLAA